MCFCVPCRNLHGVRYQVGDAPLSSISVQGNVQVGGKLVAVGDVNGTVSLLEVKWLPHFERLVGLTRIGYM